MPTLASHPVLGAVLLAVLTLTLGTASLLPPLAESASARPGCVSNAEYRRLGQGQTLRYVRRVAGDDAQVSMRRWRSYGNPYQERRYDMCNPRNPRYETLTTRFTVYQGKWRAYLVDLYVGPER